MSSLILDPEKTVYVLIVETNSYAGNFERELCAYTTGVVGECEVGRKESTLFESEVEDDELKDALCDIIGHEIDDHGCYRPASIWNGPDRSGYNDVAIFFDGLPTSEELSLVIERVKAFPTYWTSTRFGGKGLKIENIRMIKRVVTFTDEEIAI